MPYQGFPGWGACLTTQVLISRSQLLQCELCKKLLSMASQGPWRHPVVNTTSWTQCRTASRLPVWPWKTGIKLSRQIQPWVWSFLECGMEPWDNVSPNRQILFSSTSSCANEMTSYYEKVSYTEELDTGNWRRPSFSWFCQLHTEVTLRGCHVEVGNLGLDHMLDLMCYQSFWPCMAAQVKEYIEKCCPCLTFKAKQPKAPLENIMGTHLLEPVHLDYPCLEPKKGLEEYVLVVTDHFTCYAQTYFTQTQTAQTTAKTLWDKFILHYGLPGKICQIRVQIMKVSWWLISVRWWGPKSCKLAQTTHRLMASVRGSIPF